MNIGTKEGPKYVRLGDYWDDATVNKVVELLHEYQDLFLPKITELKGIIGDVGVMKITLELPTHWWGTPEGTFEDWRGCRQMMQISFGKSELKITDKYNGRDDPCMHLTKWTKAYGEEPQLEWVHLFYHTLDVIPRN